MDNANNKELSNNELDKVSGGIQISYEGTGLCRCYKCGSKDFYVINSDASTITIRCKTCNNVVKIMQEY